MDVSPHRKGGPTSHVVEEFLTFLSFLVTLNSSSLITCNKNFCFVIDSFVNAIYCSFKFSLFKFPSILFEVVFMLTVDTFDYCSEIYK